VRSVAEESHSAELHYCGGVSRSELTVCSWSRFSGFDSLYVGLTIMGRSWRFLACISTQIELLLYQVPSFIVLAVFLLLLFSYIHIHSKLVFPGGVLSRVMLTKNTCIHNVDVLVAVGGIPSWTTFLREEEDSKKVKGRPLNS
jgi:hypothetical protein